MRLGESVAVSRHEAELVTSDAFCEFAPPSLLKSLRLGDDEHGSPQRLSVPSHGLELVVALRDFAVRAKIDEDDAIVALALAERVEAFVRA